MFKRGQVSIYLIIVLVLFFLIVVVYYLISNLNSNVVPRGMSLNPRAEDTETVLNKCFQDKFLQSVYLLGLKGGHLLNPDPKINLGRGLDVGFGYHLGKNELPSKESMELEISNYLNFVVPGCVSPFSGFTIVNTSRASTRVAIYDDRVEAKLNYPLVVSKGDIKYTFDKSYDSSYNIRLGMLHGFSQQLVESELSDPNYVPLNSIENFIGKNNVTINIYDIDGNPDLDVYAIYDEKSNINGVPYVFEFANRFK